MKKSLILVAFATLLAGSAFAQEGPSKGDFGTEISFNPFDQNGNTFKLDALKLRYFLTDKDAVRLSLGFGVSKETNKQDTEEDAFSNKTQGDFSLDLGYERHFKVANRLDLYAGGEIGFLTHFASGKSEDVTSEDVVVTTEYKNYTGTNGERAYSAFEASIFTGLDFYVYKGLYVGVELGLKLESGKTLRAERKISYGNKSADTIKINDSVTTTTCEFGVTPTVRLGWTF